MKYELTLPESAQPGRFGVYALFDGDGEVLYIGQSKNLCARLNNHRSTAAWWRRVRNLEWSPCDGPTEARAAERSMIAIFRPDGNVNDKRELPRQSKQRLPDFVVSKVVEMHEAERVAGARDHAVERDALNCYLAALKAAGWKLEPLGLAIGVTRERARQRILAAPSVVTPHNTPSPPRKVVRKPKAKPVIPDDTLARLKALQVDAQRVNGPTPSDSPLRVASERYSELIAEQYLAGVSIYRISQQLGVTHLAIRARLARHGYMGEVKGLPSNVKYGTPWRSRGKQENCKAGHPLSGDNLRLVNGDPGRRQCRACARRRSEEYKARKQAAA